MKALDTCILARYFVGDDPVQTPLAEQQVEQGGFVPITVALELAWLLRSRYGYSRALVADTLSELGNLPNIMMASELSLPWIVDRMRAGADVADLIHIVASVGCQSFVTFDDMAQKVGNKSPVAVELLGV